MIEISSLSLDYGAGAVLDGLELRVACGELVALLGRSGCGKTSLLRAIAGLERPRSGQILVDGHLVDGPGQYVQPHRRGVGLVFQELALWPHRSALGNVCFGLGRDPVTGLTARKRAFQALEAMGIGALAARYPHQLSGGERQRLALARGFAPTHPVLLLDEPFSNLDAATKEPLLDLVDGIRRKGTSAVVYVTHALDEALRVADRVVVLRAGGIREELGPAALQAMDLGDLHQWYLETAKH